MTCNQCQANQATVHLTDIQKGVPAEQHLCEKCAYGKAADPFAFPQAEIQIDIYHDKPLKGKITLRVRHFRSGTMVSCEGELSEQVKLKQLAFRLLQARLKNLGSE